MIGGFLILTLILPFYVKVFPTEYYWPSITDWLWLLVPGLMLFAAVRRHTREADNLIARLEREHQLGYPMVEDLKKHLVAFQAGDETAREAFFAAADRYAELEWEHLRAEEEVFLPIAERVLSREEWAEIAVAFRENDNPLFGIKPKDEAEVLYQRILSLAPSPMGFGGREAP